MRSTHRPCRRAVRRFRRSSVAIAHGAPTHWHRACADPGPGNNASARTATASSASSRPTGSSFLRRSPSMNSTRLSACARSLRASSRARTANTAIVPSASATTPSAAVSHARRCWRRIASRWTSWSSGTPAIPATSFCTPSRQPSPCGRRSTATGAASETPTPPPNRARNDGGRHSRSALPASPPTQRLASEQHAQHRRLRVQAMEGGDFGFDPRRISRGRRAKNDQVTACGKGGLDDYAEVPAGGELIAVAEDRMQPRWNDAERPLASGQAARECDNSPARDASARPRVDRRGCN